MAQEAVTLQRENYLNRLSAKRWHLELRKISTLNPLLRTSSGAYFVPHPGHYFVPHPGHKPHLTALFPESTGRKKFSREGEERLVYRFIQSIFSSAQDGRTNHSFESRNQLFSKWQWYFAVGKCTIIVSFDSRVMR